MLVETAQIMSTTQLQKTLTQTVRKISENQQPQRKRRGTVLEVSHCMFDPARMPALDDNHRFNQIGRFIFH